MRASKPRKLIGGGGLTINIRRRAAALRHAAVVGTGGDLFAARVGNKPSPAVATNDPMPLGGSASPSMFKTQAHHRACNRDSELLAMRRKIIDALGGAAAKREIAAASVSALARRRA